MTIRHLLSHTGGTGDFFGPQFDQHRLELRTHSDYVELFGDRDVLFQPGGRFEYSNYGFILLGAVIEAVTGESYYDYVAEHVYRPAGMTVNRVAARGRRRARPRRRLRAAVRADRGGRRRPTRSRTAAPPPAAATRPSATCCASPRHSRTER